MTELGTIVEGTRIRGDRRERVDVCIIGSGCGGSTAAMRLAEAGVRVLVVEAGGYYLASRGDFDQREADMLAKIDGERGLHASEDGSIAFSYGANVGGASVHYWADTYRAPRDRLERWEREHGVRGHSADELAPHFERVERDLSVVPAPDELLNPLNQRLEAALPRLGWHGHRVPQARKHCTSSGYCMQGCSYDAKQSQLVTTIPRAVAAGAILYSDARATWLDATRGRVRALEVKLLDRATGAPNGATVRVEADRFVLALGGYQTAPFLLRNGLGDRLPALGRRLYVNPCPMVHGLFPESVRAYRGIPAGVGVDQFRLATRDRDGAYLEGGYLLMPNQLHPMTLAYVLPGVGAYHDRLMDAFPRIGGTIAWIDDEDPGSIELGRDGRVRWHYTLGPRDRPKAQDAMKKGAAWLFAAGATEVHLGDAHATVLGGPDEIARIDALALDPGEVVLAGPHPAGAAPMGADPATSVVDSRHLVWGTENLYVADPSVFPTAVSVDPSATIMAFSHRLADDLLAA